MADFCAGLAARLNVSQPCDLKWAHACNTKRQLRESLETNDAHMIEVDVTMGQLLRDGTEKSMMPFTFINCVGSRKDHSRTSGNTDELILCHFPYTKSDLSFLHFLEEVCLENDAYRRELQKDDPCMRGVDLMNLLHRHNSRHSKDVAHSKEDNVSQRNSKTNPENEDSKSNPWSAANPDSKASALKQLGANSEPASKTSVVLSPSKMSAPDLGGSRTSVPDDLTSGSRTSLPEQPDKLSSSSKVLVAGLRSVECNVPSSSSTAKTPECGDEKVKKAETSPKETADETSADKPSNEQQSGKTQKTKTGSKRKKDKTSARRSKGTEHEDSSGTEHDDSDEEVIELVSQFDPKEDTEIPTTLSGKQTTTPSQKASGNPTPTAALLSTSKGSTPAGTAADTQVPTTPTDTTGTDSTVPKESPTSTRKKGYSDFMFGSEVKWAQETRCDISRKASENDREIDNPTLPSALPPFLAQAATPSTNRKSPSIATDVVGRSNALPDVREADRMESLRASGSSGATSSSSSSRIKPTDRTPEHPERHSSDTLTHERNSLDTVVEGRNSSDILIHQRHAPDMMMPSRHSEQVQRGRVDPQRRQRIEQHHRYFHPSRRTRRPPRPRGIKLDFKKIEAVKPALDLLIKMNVVERVPVLMLNADVLHGPTMAAERYIPLLNAQTFIQECSRIPRAVLSLSWLTGDHAMSNANRKYTNTMIEQMLELVCYPIIKKDDGRVMSPGNAIDHITFAACAQYAANSPELMRKLLDYVPTSSLTLFCGSWSRGLTQETVKSLYDSFPRDRIFLDLIVRPGEEGEELSAPKETKSIMERRDGRQNEQDDNHHRGLGSRNFSSTVSEARRTDGRSQGDRDMKQTRLEKLGHVPLATEGYVSIAQALAESGQAEAPPREPALHNFTGRALSRRSSAESDKSQTKASAESEKSQTKTPTERGKLVQPKPANPAQLTVNGRKSFENQGGLVRRPSGEGEKSGQNNGQKNFDLLKKSSIGSGSGARNSNKVDRSNEKAAARYSNFVNKNDNCDARETVSKTSDRRNIDASHFDSPPPPPPVQDRINQTLWSGPSHGKNRSIGDIGDVEAPNGDVKLTTTCDKDDKDSGKRKPDSDDGPTTDDSSSSRATPTRRVIQTIIPRDNSGRKNSHQRAERPENVRPVETGYVQRSEENRQVPRSEGRRTDKHNENWQGRQPPCAEPPRPRVVPPDRVQSSSPKACQTQ